MASMKHIGWERLEQEDAVTYPVDSDDEPGHEVLFGNGFPTPSGRGKLVPAEVLPADELPDQEYPMILTTGRILEHWHTGAMTRRATNLDQIEPEAYLHLSPNDIKNLGVEPGEAVRITTRRGSLEIAVRHAPNIPAGLVFMPFCFSEAAANILTNPALDPYGKIAEVKFAAARIEKIS